MLKIEEEKKKKEEEEISSTSDTPSLRTDITLEVEKSVRTAF